MLAIGLPAAIWCAWRVRREDAEVWHVWLYGLAGGVTAVGIAWAAGYGLVGIVFFPVGVVLAVADAVFRIFDALT